MTTVRKKGGVQSYPKTNSRWILSEFSVSLLPNILLELDLHVIESIFFLGTRGLIGELASVI